jgi:hypothetical protein
MTVDASAGAADARAETQALATAAVAAGKGPPIQHTQPWRWSSPPAPDCTCYAPHRCLS